jgi:hypothetical protein
VRDGSNRAEVTAAFASPKRRDIVLESIASALGRSPSVTHAGWRAEAAAS